MVNNYSQGFECIQTLSGHTMLVVALAISPDGKTLVSSSTNGTRRVWNLPTGKLLRIQAQNRFSYDGFAISSDGLTLAVDDNGKILLSDLSTGKIKQVLTGHSSGINAIVFSPDNKTLISGSYDKTIKVWDLSSGSEIHTLSGNVQEIISLALSSDGKTLVSGSHDLTDWDEEMGPVRLSWTDEVLKVWDLTTGELLRTFGDYTYPAYSVAITPCKHVISAHSKYIEVWELETGKKIRNLEGHSDTVRCVAIAPDGETIISGSCDTTLKIWDWKTGKEINTLTGHSDSVWALAISADGLTLVSGSADRLIKVWRKL